MYFSILICRQEKEADEYRKLTAPKKWVGCSYDFPYIRTLWYNLYCSNWSSHRYL